MSRKRQSVDVNVLRRVLGFHLDPVGAAVGEGQVGDGDSFATADVERSSSFGAAVPAPATQGDPRRISGRAAQGDVPLPLENDGPRQPVVAVRQQDGAARLDAVDRREQFLDGRDADHLATGYWEGWDSNRCRTRHAAGRPEDVQQRRRSGQHRRAGVEASGAPARPRRERAGLVGGGLIRGHAVAASTSSPLQTHRFVCRFLHYLVGIHFTLDPRDLSSARSEPYAGFGW